MVYLVLLIFIILFIYIRYSCHLHIKFNSFFHKGFKPNRSKFGVYCYCGKQGSGKTYSVVEFLQKNKNKKIFANISSIKGIDYTYFSGFSELLKLSDEHDCIIVYDEIFSALTKSTKINTEVLSFLSQMRKKNIIFLTTAQEWLEINITLRRYVRWQIDCKMRNILGIGILIKKMYNAEQMKWDNLQNEYIAPLTDTTISKTNLKIAQSYDTFEQIKN